MIGFILGAIVIWAIATQNWKLLQWLGICFLPALIVFGGLVTGLAFKGAGLVGLAALAYALIGGFGVFILGIAGYGLYSMSQQEPKKKRRKKRSKPPETP